MKRGYILVAIRMLLAGFFGWAGVAKVMNRQSFAEALGNIGFLPSWWVVPLAVLLPWIEITAAIMLVVPAWARRGSLLTIYLSMIFLVFLGFAIVTGNNSECGCFGDFWPADAATAFQRAVVLFSLALTTYVLDPKNDPISAER